jgi:hypothetical protein
MLGATVIVAGVLDADGCDLPVEAATVECD